MITHTEKRNAECRMENSELPTCYHCGEQFVLSSKQRQKKQAGLPVYCSRRCAARTHATGIRAPHAKRYSKRCGHCQTPFTGHYLSRYCSDKCRAAVAKEYRRRKEDFVCEECHCTFPARRSYKPRFCSPSCAGFYNGRCRTGRSREVGPLVFKVDPMEHIGLVYKIARRLVPFRPMQYGEVPLEQTDQFQDGCVGLLYACARFDTAKGVKFSTWAWSYIRGYILSGRNKWRQSSKAYTST